MKLQYQLTAAFTSLLVIIMSLAGITIYSLILNLLIQDEQRQLQDNGELLVNILRQDYNVANIQRLSQLLEEQDMQMFAYDQFTNQLLLTTLPISTVQEWVETYDLNSDKQPLWKAGNEQYVVSRIALYPDSPGTQLVFATPLDDLQAVQKTFIVRLLLVLVIGMIVAILLSHFLTKRLVTPLTRLRHQLKKIEKRQFDDLNEIEASGEIKEVEHSVLEMAQELERYIQTQRHFFQNASHELKTPLMTIQGYAEGIRDGIFVEEESDRGLDVIVEEIKRLKKIINEMILLAKLDSEEDIYEEELIKIDNLLKLTVERALPLANEKDKSIHVKNLAPTSLTVYADKGKLLQAMMNVVTNAVRHAFSTVVISAVQGEGAQVTITVEDDGEGIAEDIIPHLFQRFVKGEGGETGLGLAISRAIIDRSGGEISVGKSTLGGAKFTIIF
ncbi:sensor histidine kinase [Aquibacillus salsiterrae]|uniref:histidine kinase n=1 Tax=Aquibacillus salsiterrae TaxID=2950439 RepID=A0A9X4AEX3_9BACI|nr:HAMP domain-containing sensor histidine kinase [Aquibacillus salsiterrae]MDC3417054.1 HAMP domain-containing histidine kinase [Aquibacillus salsiterrae]